MTSSTQITFVIGAGASDEYGFPISRGLTFDIVECLKSVISELEKEINNSAETYDGVIFVSLKKNLVEVNIVINCIKYLALEKTYNSRTTVSRSKLKKFRAVAISLKNKLEPCSVTIDNLLSRPQISDDERMLSKIIIAAIIKRYENSSLLYESETENRSKKISYDDENLQKTYLVKLISYLCGQHHVASDVLKNINFIIFNYDRCVEQAFFKYLQKSYDLSNSEAQSIVNNCNIIHPHGLVEKFDLQKNGDTNFGHVSHLTDLDMNLDNGFCEQFTNVSTQSIHMHTERHLDPAIKEKIEDSIYNANRLFFIGFGYLKDNIQILESQYERTRSGERIIFANLYDQSEVNIFMIKSLLFKIINNGHFYPWDKNFEAERHIKASGMIDQYSLYLS